MAFTVTNNPQAATVLKAMLNPGYADISHWDAYLAACATNAGKGINPSFKQITPPSTASTGNQLGLLAPNGCIYITPYGETSLKINTITDTCSVINMESALSSNWNAGVLGNNNKLYWIGGGRNILCLDPTTEERTYNLSPIVDDFTHTFGLQIGQDGKVYTMLKKTIDTVVTFALGVLDLDSLTITPTSLVFPVGILSTASTMITGLDGFIYVLGSNSKPVKINTLNYTYEVLPNVWTKGSTQGAAKIVKNGDVYYPSTSASTFMEGYSLSQAVPEGFQVELTGMSRNRKNKAIFNMHNGVTYTWSESVGQLDLPTRDWWENTFNLSGWPVLSMGDGEGLLAQNGKFYSLPQSYNPRIIVVDLGMTNPVLPPLATYLSQWFNTKNTG